ncbi:ABC transporter permease [Rhodococcus sp. BP-349]|uniref:ABC transporter permease n=1 Tax=unclassified Rhodococcus (in: high G+C Gram-positive bacteria) TaxID=192944 RepID=UPI001C9A619B|nr:ABC transporter permease [Rhodococcus sp. BP-363]MBY6542293.1 ABC transporter permease [Rhodococcus sp. BP-369]MBY6561523.1 ABC transporter permease [Rhodococcus sp. BP-370]MBY6575815.1 ABC transporter permease [Rhodococcus sp. BP-364]MBY6585116.1 ABC transporter permease [Rhodococcus sp. BP-358]MBY6589453.1 ABC transporter permease [Rhodococcus sp. BP-362]MBY6594014.1 ABC transporter permease [Rhodococcus sp. BP-359]MBY6598129.1 ABC transporter permease [Rhodococcus sp. BP-353]MBY660269
MVLEVSDVAAAMRRRTNAASEAVDVLGERAIFFTRALASTGRAVRSYRGETMRVIAEISLGTGVLAAIGGSIVILGFLTLFAGATVAVQGFDSLGSIGVDALTGFLAAYVNVRVVAPVTAGVGLAATIGAGTTAALGAMRISEEIDALEVMAIKSLTYLVGTRIVAGIVAVVPLYALSLITSFLASRVATVVVLGQSGGVYDHYFSTFLVPTDVLWSFVQVIVMAVAVMVIHTYYGYTASGGPAGVGTATGRAVRLSLITVVSVTLLISLALYGSARSVHLAG